MIQLTFLLRVFLVLTFKQQLLATYAEIYFEIIMW